MKRGFFKMNDFRTQIREDIKEYQLRYPNISNIEKMNGRSIIGF